MTTSTRPRTGSASPGAGTGTPGTASHPPGPASRLTSRWGARLSVLLGLLVALGAIGLLGSAEAPPRGDGLPDDAEAAQVAAQVEQMPGSDVAPVLLVATPSDGGPLSQADLDRLRSLGGHLGDQTGHDVAPPRTSDDGQAAILLVPMTVAAESSEDAETVAALRETVAEHRPSGLEVAVTGGPAFGADVASAFEGANLTLLLVTVTIVAVLLLLTYRSPVLWLLPLAVIGLADQLAGRIAAGLGQWSGLDFDAGIVSVLVFGAGTNYALLLISRYREQLRVEDDHRRALAQAWRASAPAIVASSVTVVLALLTLLLAVVPSTRGLGLASAAGLLVALAAVLLVLPGVLAMAGRRVFWPFVPRVTDHQGDGGGWARVARGVAHRPLPVLLAGLAALGLMASGLAGSSVGLSQADSFRGSSESATGLATMSQHFPAGEAAPFDVVADRDHIEEVTQAAEDVPGVVEVHPASRPDAEIARISVIGSPSPGSPESLDLVTDLRDAVHGVPDAEAKVGGATAETLDARGAAARDLRVVAPLILVVATVVLLVLLRSVLAPLVLLSINLASALAAIGAGAWLSDTVLGFPALDSAVPLLAVLFLVALGIDYTIFLVHRVQTETRTLGTVRGTVRAVGRTGAVITSAGIVLAGVFAALGVLPLVVLAQLGLIVGLGVLVDTLVVRTLLVPATIVLLGDRFWWPAGAAGRAR